MTTWVTRREYRISASETQFDFISKVTEHVDGTERDLRRYHCHTLGRKMTPEDWIHKESATAHIYFSPATDYLGKGIQNFRKGVFRYLDINGWSMPEETVTIS